MTVETAKPAGNITKRISPTNKIVTINVVVDVVGALAQGSLADNIYLYDNNKANGSEGQGTDSLQSIVQVGDRVLWTVEPIEPEAYASITDIEPVNDCIQLTQGTYPGSDVTYWEGVVTTNITVCPYKIKILLGTQAEPLLADTGAALMSR